MKPIETVVAVTMASAEDPMIGRRESMTHFDHTYYYLLDCSRHRVGVSSVMNYQLKLPQNKEEKINFNNAINMNFILLAPTHHLKAFRAIECRCLLCRKTWQVESAQSSSK